MVGGGSGTSRSATVIMTIITAGRFVNDMVSFIVFSILDLLDLFLCVAYKLMDYKMEAEWKPCYCSSSAKDVLTSSGNILFSEDGESKIVCLSSTKLHLEEISDTLYCRPSLVSEFSRAAVAIATAFRSTTCTLPNTTTFTINSTIVEMLQGKIGAAQSSKPMIPRWSDCSCKTCTCWTSLPAKGSSLFVHADGGPKAKGNPSEDEDVLFIHGFISSSMFWTETVFPNLTEKTKSKYRLFAVDLLGFGRSPKPADSLYTLREHVDMIQRSVLVPYKVKSFHIVAHSLGSILALALAVKYRDSVKSLTLIAPPYFPAPEGEKGAQYVLRKVAPRRVWPPIVFGTSVACWYEHISRTICLLICKNHLVWESIAKLLVGNRMRTFLMDGFFCHTHYAAWHTLHNIICGSSGKIDKYLDIVRDEMDCQVTIFHGGDDEVLPIGCSHEVGLRIPRARVKIVEKKDHITIVVGRQKTFARELEGIWNRSKQS